MVVSEKPAPGDELVTSAGEGRCSVCVHTRTPFYAQIFFLVTSLTGLFSTGCGCLLDGPHVQFQTCSSHILLFLENENEFCRNNMQQLVSGNIKFPVIDELSL